MRGVASSTRGVSTGSPAITRKSIVVATRPISRRGWRTVVKAGVSSSAYGISSKPTTLMSVGDRQAVLVQGPIDAKALLVAADKDRGGRIGQRQERAHLRVGPRKLPVAVADECRIDGQVRLVQGGPIAGQPIARAGEDGRAEERGDAAMAKCEQVGGCRSAAGPIGRAHREILRSQLAQPVHDHERDLMAPQLTQVLRGLIGEDENGAGGRARRPGGGPIAVRAPAGHASTPARPGRPVPSTASSTPRRISAAYVLWSEWTTKSICAPWPPSPSPRGPAGPPEDIAMLGQHTLHPFACGRSDVGALIDHFGDRRHRDPGQGRDLGQRERRRRAGHNDLPYFSNRYRGFFAAYRADQAMSREPSHDIDWSPA